MIRPPAALVAALCLIVVLAIGYGIGAALARIVGL